MPGPKIGLKRLNETIPASFSSFYLTLISLIQGVALGLLATKLPAFISSHAFLGLLYAVYTFVVIVIVWHEYVLAAQEFWWEITWLDSVVPFLLGTAEYLMIDYLGRGPFYAAWFFAASFAGFGGFLAYVNYDLWITEANFDNSEAFQLFQSEVRRGRLLFISLAGLNAISGIFVRMVYRTATLLTVTCFFGLSLMVMIAKRLSWYRRALLIYGWHK